MSTKKDSEGKQPNTLSKVRNSEATRFADLVLSALAGMDWGVEDFARLYGITVKNKPYTRERIYQMIWGDSFPEDPRRRYAIATLLQMPAALLSLPTLEHLLATHPAPQPKIKALAVSKNKGKLDIEEFQRSLNTLNKQYYTGLSQEEALYETKVRLQILHNEALYTGDEDFKRVKRLVCGYQMTAGRILRDQFQVHEAEHRLNKAVLLAKNNDFHTLYIDALLQRGLLFLDRGKIVAPHDFPAAKRLFSQALGDFTNAQKYITEYGEVVPALREDTQLAADLLLLIGVSHAPVADDRKTFKQSVKEVDAAGKLMEHGSDRDKGIYHVDRASIFIWAPAKELHDSKSAYESLEEAAKYIGPDQPRRYAFMHITEAQVQFNKGWYPAAIETANEAITLLKPLRSGIHIARLANLHDALKGSSYGKNVEVAEMAVNLMKLRYPHLFPG